MVKLTSRIRKEMRELVDCKYVVEVLNTGGNPLHQNETLIFKKDNRYAIGFLYPEKDTCVVFSFPLIGFEDTGFIEGDKIKLFYKCFGESVSAQVRVLEVGISNEENKLIEQGGQND